MPSISSRPPSLSGRPRARRGRWLEWLLVAALAPVASCVAQTNEAAVRYLDAAHATLTQPVDPTRVKSGETKFVEVQVAEVVNPANAGLTFEVDFEPAGALRLRLGTFSLFPANNPGTFIVPTQGKVD